MERSFRQRISKKTVDLNSIIDQMNLTDTCSTVYPRKAEYTYFSSAHGTFSRIDHMLAHKTSLSKFRKTEITTNIFSEHNSIKLEIIKRG